MIENFTKMVGNSLNLEAPWCIEGARFDEDELVVHIHVGIDKDAQIACPACGGSTTRYGYEPEERIWRHSDCFFFPCYVHCHRPRVQCDKCGVKQVNAPFERKNSRFTLMFEGYAMLILADMPISKTAKLLRCNEKSLVSIMRYWVNKAVESTGLSDITTLAIDETSFKRGHKYVTLVIDAAKRRVIDVEEGRDMETIRRFCGKLSAKGGDPDNISSVTSDMSSVYLPAIEQYFPNAETVIDKFHVKKVLIDAMEKVRKEEQRDVRDKIHLFRGRRLFMIPKAKQTKEQAWKISEMAKRYPETGRACRIVAALDDFYASQTLEEAQSEFEGLYSWMRRCRLEPMKRAADTLIEFRNKILAYFTNRATNAICEGLNSMIQAAKRKARGYQTFEGFACMIYLIVGKLNLAVPKPF